LAAVDASGLNGTVPFAQATAFRSMLKAASLFELSIQFKVAEAAYDTTGRPSKDIKRLKTTPSNIFMFVLP
jgi:hypothetical protein